MNKVRVSVLLEPSTIELLEKEAKDKSISLSAVIRQKVNKQILSDTFINRLKTDGVINAIEFGTGNGKTDV